MIEYILRNIKEQNDYMTALAMFRIDEPLTEAEVKELIPLYQKYGQDTAHPELAKQYMALDLMPGRGREDITYFTPLSLPEDNLSMLFLAKETITLLKKDEAPDVDVVDAAVASAINGSAARPIDIFLARSILNYLPLRWDFGGFRKQAAELAAFLISTGASTMIEYELFLGEAWNKCRN